MTQSLVSRFRMYKMLRVPALIVAGSVVVLLSGCAFGNRHVQLVPSSGGGYARVNGDYVVGVQKFQDLRVESALGEVRNGWGMRTASVVADGQDVGAWVSDSVAEELAGAGLKVRRYQGDEVPADASVLIRGEVLEAFVKMFMSFDATMRARVVVSAQGTDVLDQQFTGSSKAVAMWASTAEYQEQLRAVHRNLLDQIVPAILELFR